MLPRELLALLELGLLVYCLIDCLQTDSLVVRNLSKGWWIVLILVLPVIGGIAWLVAGRPEGRRSGTGRVAWPSTATAGFPEYERPARGGAPDDDPEFLRSLRESNRDHEQMLERWERDLREREERLRAQRPDEQRPDEQRPGDDTEAAGEPPAPR